MGFESVLGAKAECWVRSEEHTSELQSLTNLVCRLLLEKKKKTLSSIQSHDKRPRTTERTSTPSRVPVTYAKSMPSATNARTRATRTPSALPHLTEQG